MKKDPELLEEFAAKMRMYQESVLPPFLFALVVDVVTMSVKEDALNRILYVDGSILMSETIEVL